MPLLESLLQSAENSRCLAVLAHCDDEVVVCGGLLARLRDGGGSVRVVILCGRDGARRLELERACAVLDVEFIVLDYEDARLHEGLFPELVGLVVDHVRDFQPDLVVTHDPDFDYNPDHRLLARCVLHGSQKAGMNDRGHRPDLLISGEIHNALPFPDYLVDVSGQQSRVEEAMSCHTSQISAEYKKDFYHRLLHTRAAWRGAQAGCAYAMAFRRHALPVIGHLYGRALGL